MSLELEEVPPPKVDLHRKTTTRAQAAKSNPYHPIRSPVGVQTGTGTGCTYTVPEIDARSIASSQGAHVPRSDAEAVL